MAKKVSVTVERNKSFFEEELRLLLDSVTWQAGVDDRSDVPAEPGVYIFVRKGAPAYVGETGNIRRRLVQHLPCNNSAFCDALRKGGVNGPEEFVANGKFSWTVLSHNDKWTPSWRRQFEHFVIAMTGPKYNLLEPERRS
ncbi:MAG: GIY-YIG nuclease family protein [Dehalococcoidia bacterium]|nr:GIY-YIG nuclease family protein [Dehalococcoidia bacterium]